MRIEKREIARVPAIILGENTGKGYLFIHGKMGNKEEAIAFAEIACPAGFQVIGIDLPEHGSRKDSAEKLLPWVAVPEIAAVYRELSNRWQEIGVRANSIGAWLAMQALQGQKVRRALLVSPIVDMERLITDMMGWAGVTEEQLRQRGEIPTAFGETLSWEYLCWVREHPINWQMSTRILYAAKDHLTPRDVMESFVQASGSLLTVMQNGEHWFHTEEQLQFLRDWEQTSM